MSLAHKVAQAAADLNRGDMTAACATVLAFIHEVKAQRSKSITRSLADILISQAQQVRSFLRC